MDRTRKIVYISILSAMAAVLMYFPCFSILPGFPFLKVDFSDIPTTMGAVAISPAAGIVIAAIKNIFHLPGSNTGYVGELSNFIQSTSFCVTAAILCRKLNIKKEKIRECVSLAAALLVEVIVGVFSNYYIMVPLYFADKNGVAKYILTGVIPFNLIKYSIEGILFYIIYRSLYPYIMKKIRTD